MSRIFEPFFTTKNVGRGIGLGLASVFGIIKQHEGHITCSSEPGVGTVFKIYLPAVETRMRPCTQKDSLGVPAGTETILLVDDEHDVRNLGKRILTRAGYPVLTAGNGREALDIYREEQKKISLVILDLVTPEMDGHHCLEAILRLNPQAKIIISRGYSADGSPEKTSEAGPRSFVGKPYDRKQLLRTVREVLDRSC